MTVKNNQASERTLEDQCNEYLSIIPKGAPEVQIVETRRAFMAGASAMFFTLVQVSDNRSEEEAGSVLSKYSEELMKFSGDVASGKA